MFCETIFVSEKDEWTFVCEQEGLVQSNEKQQTTPGSTTAILNKFKCVQNIYSRLICAAIKLLIALFSEVDSNATKWDEGPNCWHIV